MARTRVVPFRHQLDIVFNGQDELSWARQVYRSQDLDMQGYTLVNAYVSLSILSDTNIGSTFALLGSLITVSGSAESRGPWSMVGIGIPFGFNWGKNYVGPGTYALNLAEATSQVDSEGSVLATAAHWKLSAVGRPLGRVMQVRIEGSLVAGKTNMRQERCGI